MCMDCGLYSGCFLYSFKELLNGFKGFYCDLLGMTSLFTSPVLLQFLVACILESLSWRAIPTELSIGLLTPLLSCADKHTEILSGVMVPALTSPVLSLHSW